MAPGSNPGGRTNTKNNNDNKNMNTEAFKRFASKATESESIFLRPSDIEGTHRIRIIPWLYSGNPEHIHFFYEGWKEISEQGRKGSKPVRIEINEEGEYDLDDEIKWAKSEFGGIQRPVPCFVCVVADYSSKSIKILSGTQKTILGPLTDMVNPEKERFVKNWNKVELLITKDEKGRKFTVERDKLDDDEMPDWMKSCLEDFNFDMDMFMRCEKQTEEDGIKYEDVLKELNIPHQETEDKSKQHPDNYIEGWENVKTPQGKRLGDCSEEQLKEFLEVLNKNKNTDKKGKLYLAICSGIDDYYNAKNIGSSEDVAF